MSNVFPAAIEGDMQDDVDDDIEPEASKPWRYADEAINALSRAEERLIAIEFMVGFALAGRELQELPLVIKVALFETEGFIHTAKLRLESLNNDA